MQELQLGRDMEVGTEAEVVEECGSVTSFHGLFSLLSNTAQGHLPGGAALPTEGWAFPHHPHQSLINKVPIRFGTGQSDGGIVFQSRFPFPDVPGLCHIDRKLKSTASSKNLSADQFHNMCSR